jgi:ribonuclease E
MAFKANLEAAEEIPHQLRLRDVGGQIVIDFIEMKDKKHIREVEKTLRAGLKSDKARTDMSPMSRFGLVQLVRQRLGISALSVTMQNCPFCQGTGMVRNLEWRAQQVLKEIYRTLRRKHCPETFEYKTEPELALYILNHKRDKLRDWEVKFGRHVHILCYSTF